ncbi:RNA-binding protein 25 [Frankliniella fusca]|uniref:RNA-binding protein 25 n=1 Tax=Frankliniella fusca TaxID=407009 RepID=A0AAE1LJG7_9NEOP|nr:RNA-binding protein 25 [Frankliniella fusca]
MVMSFPGRPPLVPAGIPLPSTMPMPYVPIGGAPSHFMQVPMPHMLAGPAMATMGGPPIRPFPQPRTSHQNPPSSGSAPSSNSAPRSERGSYQNRRNAEPVEGPTITVFVGNITEKAPDAMIRHILATCGPSCVQSWKRVQAFGFCEFAGPDSALRAIRLLHDMEVGNKKLVVKVDSKTQIELDKYKVLTEIIMIHLAEKREKRSSSPLQDEAADEDDYLSEEMRQADRQAMERIRTIMHEFEPDLNNASHGSKERSRKDSKISRTQEKLMKLSRDGAGEDGDISLNLDDADIEEGKRDLITREIGKFRETMKVRQDFISSTELHIEYNF